MRVIDLALKDLLQMARDWRASVFLLVMPILFTLMFGIAFGGFGGVEQGDPRLPVVLVDRDQGLLVPHLVHLLENSPALRLERQESSDSILDETVSESEAAAAVIVPEGYSQGLLAGEERLLTIIAKTGDMAGQTAQGEVQAAATRLVRSLSAAQLSLNQVEARSGFASAGEREAFLIVALEKAVGAWDDPPVSVKASTIGTEAEGTEEAENSFSQSSPGMMAQFAIAGLMGASSVIVMERKSKALLRLLTTAISRTEILLGHYLAMFVLIFVQLVILILFGQLFLRLDYLSQLPATTLMAMATAMFVASMGLLIGALAKSEDQVVVFGLIPMFVLSGLGGAWVPLEITPEGFRRIARLTPVAWIMDGFQDIIIRGLGLEAVILGVGVLVGYAAVLFAVAVWQFRFE